MANVEVNDGNIEKAIKALKRMLQREGILKEIKRRSFYEKPSERERRKQKRSEKATAEGGKEKACLD